MGAFLFEVFAPIEGRYPHPTPATEREPESVRLWFLLRMEVYGSENLRKEGFSYEPRTAKLNYLKSHRRIHKI